MINLLANIAIMFAAAYFYMRNRSTAHTQGKATVMELITSIVFEVIVGMTLLGFSTVIFGIRYDFRFLFFSFSAKYVDVRITVPSIIILAIFRFHLGADRISWMNLLMNIILALALPMLAGFVKDKVGDRLQLLILVTCSVLLHAIFTIYLIPDNALALLVSLSLFASGYAGVFVLHYYISDLSDLMLATITDDLTKLRNVSAFNRDLLAIERRKRPVTLAIIDIDYFKEFNDRFGHDVGDAVLKQFSEVLLESSGPDLMFYRIGGEEFAAVIDNQNQPEAERLIFDLQNTIAGKSFFIRKAESKNVTISAGLAHSCKDEPLKATLKRADVALYHAKRTGRNRVVVSIPDADQVAFEM